MEYRLRYNAENIALAVERAGDAQFKAAIGDNRFEVTFQRISDSRLHLIVNGRQTAAFVADTPAGKSVTVNGRAWLLENESARGARTRNAPQCGPSAVTPPMPAVVTKLLVTAGETVEKGQGLLVVSAMKMDTTLTAPFDGVVKQINVAEGDKVSPKQVLVDIETDSAAE